jgi:hypothetical protein
MLSVLMLRHVDPQAAPLVVMDLQTHNALSKAGHPLLATANVSVHDVEGATAVERSRVLKTSLRARIDGAFLFLDCDSMPVGRMDDIPVAGADFAAAHDRHRGSACRDNSAGQNVELFKRMGWNWPPPFYPNSGVTYWADNAATQALGQRWHELWRDQFRQTGDHRDQPSLSVALAQQSPRIAVLPIRYNAIPEAAPCFARKARILHYFTGTGQPTADSALEKALERFRERRWQPTADDYAAVQEWSQEHPWPARRAEPALQYEQWLWQAIDRVDNQAVPYFAAEFTRRTRSLRTLLWVWLRFPLKWFMVQFTGPVRP